MATSSAYIILVFLAVRCLFLLLWLLLLLIGRRGLPALHGVPLTRHQWGVELLFPPFCLNRTATMSQRLRTDRRNLQGLRDKWTHVSARPKVGKKVGSGSIALRRYYATKMVTPPCSNRQKWRRSA